MINDVTLIGRLGRDPELRTTTTGKMFCTASIATTAWNSKTETETTTWHNVQAWDKLAEIIANKARKGLLVYARGSIQHREYETKEGQKRTSTDIVLREFRMLERSGARADAPAQQPAGAKPETQAPASTPMDEDQIPF